jgi:hypothetical protein
MDRVIDQFSGFFKKSLTKNENIKDETKMPLNLGRTDSGELMQYKDSAVLEGQSPDQTEDASYYVSANGNDANNGRSEDTPFKTLQKAIDRAVAGAIKKITVIGAVTGNFKLENAGSEEILIIGKPDAQEVKRARILGIMERALISGGIEIINSTVRFIHVQIANNTGTGLDISGKAAVTLGQDVLISNCNNVDSGGGGAVIMGASSLNMTDNAVISDNTAFIGGGVAVLEDSSLNMADTAIIYGNTAYNGGGITLRSSYLNMTNNAVISGNTAANDGGGVYLSENSTLSIYGSAKISGNAAKESGGGVEMLKDCKLNMLDDAAISGNTAESGGGVWLHENSILSMFDNAAISGNTASSGGGVTLHENGIIKGGKITGNIASGEYDEDGDKYSFGGGIWVVGGKDCMIENVEISGNRATHGAGIYVNGRLTVSGGDITGNTAESVGGGVLVRSGAVYNAKGVSVHGNKAWDSGNDVVRR